MPASLRARRSLSVLWIGLAAGCSPGVMFGVTVPAPTPTNGPQSAADGGGTPSVTGDAGLSGLPCSVAAFVSERCSSCHASPPQGGAPMSLLGRSAFLAPAGTSGFSVGAQCVARLHDAAAPMPPGGPLATADTADFEAWVDGGMPAGSCTSVDAGTSIYETPLVCTSGKHWNGQEGSSMRPGEACLTCHHGGGSPGPVYSVMGTVYPTAHEPDDCNGAATAGLSVVVTDAAGKTVTASVVGAGDFHAGGTLTFPIRAKVTGGGRERAMSGAVATGNCNLCHTQDGAQGAPGRIMAP